MDKEERLLTRQKKTFKEYRHLMLTEGKEVCIVNIIKGRLYTDHKTANPAYEPYSTREEAVARLRTLAAELEGQGFADEPREILFAFQEKERYTYDKAKWHYDGEFPQELDHFQAYVPTGMFVSWLIHHDLLSRSSCKENAEGIKRVKCGDMTGAEFYRIYWDGVMTSRDLSDEADNFAREYLNIHEDTYTAVDFTSVLAQELPTLYHVEDSQVNYSKLDPVITQRYKEWQLRRRTR